MKIDITELSQHITPLKPIYLVSGDEPLLIEETAEKIQQAAKTQQFDEWISWQVSNQFDWEQFHSLSENFSLFASKRFIQLRFTQNMNEAAKKALEQYCQALPAEQVLLILTPKLEAAQTKNSWYQTILSKGIHIAVWPVTRQQLPSWLKQRLSQAGFSIDNESLTLFVEQVDGNLLAAKQEIEKLKLLLSPGALSRETLLEALSDHARFDIFKLVDACLAGEATLTIRMLQQLQQEGIDPILILWALKRESMLLLNLLEGLPTAPIEALLQKHGIWEKKKALYRNSLKRISLPQIQKVITQFAGIDKSIKGLDFQNPWLLLESSCLLLCNKTAK